MLQDMVLAAVNEAIRSAQELANRKLGGLTGGLGGLGLPGTVDARQLMFSPPVNRLITELSKLPGIGQRTAQRLAFHILRVPDEEALALAEAIREVKEKVGLCEVCFNLADAPRCRICADERARPLDDLRRRGAGRRDPDRAHARVPRRSITCSAARCRRSTASTRRT